MIVLGSRYAWLQRRNFKQLRIPLSHSQNPALAPNYVDVEVVEVEYLGSRFHYLLSTEPEVSARLQSARLAFYRLTARVWRSRILPMILKVRLYVSLVVSILLYGLQARCLSKSQEARLERYQNRCL